MGSPWLILHMLLCVEVFIIFFYVLCLIITFYIGYIFIKHFSKLTLQSALHDKGIIKPNRVTIRASNKSQSSKNKTNKITRTVSKFEQIK